MRRLVKIITSLVITSVLVGASYCWDMERMLNKFATERLVLLNYATLEMDIQERMIYNEVSDKLEGKDLDTYIISKCHMTPNMRIYFNKPNKESSAYYESTREMRDQLVSTIDDLCDFLDTVDEKYPKIYIKKESE